MTGLARIAAVAGVEDDISGAWCNGSLALSSLLEAISFVTPTLERFYIATVRACLAERPDAALDRGCREFMRQEATHSAEHGKFNASLVAYLRGCPPGLGAIASLLRRARSRLAPAYCLLLTAALEHLSATLSLGYLARQSRWRISSARAGALFAWHAREEVGHRSVVIALWQKHGAAGPLSRRLAALAIVVFGGVYLCAAVPWILHRKTGGRLLRSVAALAVFAASRFAGQRAWPRMLGLSQFVRGDYHCAPHPKSGEVHDRP